MLHSHLLTEYSTNTCSGTHCSSVYHTFRRVKPLRRVCIFCWLGMAGNDGL